MWSGTDGLWARRQPFRTCIIGGLVILMAAAGVQAHGVITHYEIRPGVEITARYDTGQPMAGAQVTVYAPPESGFPASQPWMTGMCDDQGRFAFMPDAALPGIWSVRVRQAGHGDMLHIPVEADSGTSLAGPSTTGSMHQTASGFTPLQLGLMIVSVIWGCIGCALYFSRKRIS